MKKIKFIANFALVGFVVSFIAGLFSRRGFFSIVLFALLFAVVFALLGFVIQFLLSSVLSVDSLPRSDAPSSTGNLVDIVVKDEDLPDEKGAPSFDVGENRQMLHKDDYGGGKDVQESGGIDTIHEVSENATVSKKQESGGSVQSGSFTETGETAINASGENADSAVATTYNPLDELPSFDNLDELATGSGVSDSAQSGTMSETGEGGTAQAETFSEAKKGKAGSGKTFSEADTAFMAKAISTVLVKDKG